MSQELYDLSWGYMDKYYRVALSSYFFVDFIRWVCVIKYNSEKSVFEKGFGMR